MEAFAMPKAVKTRRQWAAAVCAAHKQCVDGFFKTGQTLLAANAALPHGTFLKMIEADLPFKARTAQMLMAIARDKRITNTKRASYLPVAWTTLFELTKLSDAAFEQALRSGSINPEMTRAEAQTLRFEVSEAEPAYTLPTVAYGPATVAVPRYVTADRANDVPTPSRIATLEDLEAPPMRVVTSSTPPADDLPTDVGSLALSRIERSVDELEMTIKRGNVRAEEFDRRIRVVAGRLLSLVETIN
jgi:hypothetical protein